MKRILVSTATAASLLVVAGPAAASEDFEAAGLSEPTYLVYLLEEQSSVQQLRMQDVMARATQADNALSTLAQSINDASNAVLSNLK